MKLPREYVFFAYRDFQHADGGWKGSNGLGYHMNLIPKDEDYRDVVAFSFERSMQLEMQNKRKALRRVVAPLYMFNENDGADDNLSWCTSGAEMT